VVAKLRAAIGKTTDSFQLDNLVKAYAEVVPKLKEGDPGAADEVAALRAAIGKTTDSSQLEALVQAYAAVAPKLKEGAADEVAALRAAIGKATDSLQLRALAAAYAAVAKTHPQVITPERDLAVLIARMSWLRTPGQCTGFAAAIKEATGRLSWDRAGLVVTAALLEPVCAESPSRLVKDYEEAIRQRADAPKLTETESWSGDVWAFAKWARDNMPGFDPYRPNVEFLGT
jgi:hypothetical protein